MSGDSMVMRHMLARFVDEASRRAKGDRPISNHNPPDIRDALVLAAAIHDVDEIDRITDDAAAKYPERFVPRHFARPQFLTVDRNSKPINNAGGSSATPRHQP